MGADLDHSLCPLASAILFPGAKFRKHKGAVKLHTLLDLQDKVHDVNILDQILPEAGAFCFMDRGYVDLERPRCVPAAIARPSEPFPTDVESA